MRLSESQHRIVHILRRKGAMTVDALSRELGISGVAVRQHLEALTAEGLLHIRTQRRPVGRPRRLFQLSEAAEDLFPKKYAALAQAILNHLVTTGCVEQVEEIFRARSQRLESALKTRLAPNADLATRVAALAEMQDRAGYMAEWEAAPDGSFTLRELNCAICLIAQEYPQACANELLMIENVTGAEVTREQHMAAGDASCTYRIRPPTLH
jgi:predicted ArsR family transcriptional regulator